MAPDAQFEPVVEAPQEGDGIFERMEHQIAMQDPVALDRLKIVLAAETEGEPEIYELLYRSYVIQMATALDDIEYYKQPPQTDTGEEERDFKPSGIAA